jgi:solute carrier family 25 (peroxisomal adenine nucleotide transporter), member 17
MQAQLLKATLTQALLFGIKDILEGYTLILMIAVWRLRGRVAAGEWRKYFNKWK